MTSQGEAKACRAEARWLVWFQFPISHPSASFVVSSGGWYVPLLVTPPLAYRAGAGTQCVVTAAAYQRIISGATLNPVIIRAAHHHVIAATGPTQPAPPYPEPDTPSTRPSPSASHYLPASYRPLFSYNDICIKPTTAFSAMFKRQQTTIELVKKALVVYQAIPVKFYEYPLEQALELSARLGIYAYDAYLVQCALQTNPPLLTLDRRLRIAAETIGVRTLEI